MDNNCNLHGPFHGMVCSICFNVAKGMEILASNPPDIIDHTYTGTLEREIEILLNERRDLFSRRDFESALSRAEAAETEVAMLRSRLALAEKVIESLRADMVVSTYFDCPDPFCDFETCIAIRAYDAALKSARQLRDKLSSLEWVK